MHYRHCGFVTASEGHERETTPTLRAGAVREAGVNVAIITLRHCRGLSASLADAPLLKSFAEVRRAQRLGPASARAHRALFAGLLPDADPDPALPDHSLPAELCESGYQTVGVGQDPCFEDSELVTGFESFRRLDHDAPEQLAALIDGIDVQRPFFAFANLKDTRFARNTTLVDQVAAVQRVDAALPSFISALPANTLVITASDHGVCFGEGNCWGPRKDHPSHRDVFTVRFRLDGEPCP